MDPVKRITQVNYDGPTEIGLRFGAFAHPLKQQICDQFPDIRFKRQQLSVLRELQRDADAAVRLFLRDVLTDSERKKVCKRLTRRVTNLVRESLV